MAPRTIKMSRSSVVKATNEMKADLTGRLATLYSWIAETPRMSIQNLIDKALAQGIVSGRRPDNHIEWDVRQLVKLGACIVVPERRSTERLYGIEIAGRRYGLYVPSGRRAPRDMRTTIKILPPRETDKTPRVKAA